jgi:hypothetical protein
MGNSVCPLLDPGQYDVRCTAAGFKVAVRRGIVLELQAEARIDFPDDHG